MSGIFLHYHCD